MDDTSLYSHSNVKDVDSRAVDMNETLASIANWSQDSNLALNPAETKCMLFSTPQMSSYHSLAERPIHLSVGDKPLERVHSIKLLGVHMTDTLKWDDHVKYLASSCYGVLAALRKIANFLFCCRRYSTRLRNSYVRKGLLPNFLNVLHSTKACNRHLSGLRQLRAQ